MKYDSIKFSSHAIKRMFERKISKSEIIYIVKKGNIIKEYPDDNPYPSFLIAGFIKTRPIHIVTAYDGETKICYIVTVYEPDPELWKSDFTERKLS